ncbi:izumo sperm-egg fusion protein 1 [Leptodactylus fuscus]|uniref:izumo sperm-egg fusion protein 1 n=1 Tax=Leptodactylus fuscus TaxID=238119 RepID=UPI003F4E5673
MMWHLMLITSFFIGQSLCCIQCDPRGKEAMNEFKNLIRSQVDENPEAYSNIQRFAKAAQQELLDYLEDEVGMLDTYAITELVSEYKRSINVIKGTKFKEVQLLHIIALHFQTLKSKLKVIAQDSTNRKCPNKQGADSCGLMIQSFTNCKSCVEEKIVCAGGPPKNQEYFDKYLKTGLFCFPCKDHKTHVAEAISCGERNIEVIEDDDLILDCNFGWHARLEQAYKNTFWKHGHVEQRVTEDPYLEIKGIQMQDSGRYSCTTSLYSGVPVSSIVYHVTVLSGSQRATKKYQARPTLPDVLDVTARPLLEVLGKNNKVLPIIIAVAGALTVTIVLLAGICICIFCRKKKKQEPVEPV